MTQSPAPDLLKGFAILDTTGTNQWRTQIECALLKKRNGRESWSYLTKECRAEDIFPKKRRMIRGPNNAYEFRAAIVWDAPFFIRSGSWLFDVSTENSRGRPPANTPAPIEYMVSCPLADTNTVSFEDTLNILGDVENFESYNLFLKLHWVESETEYTLYTPYRYANFNGPTSDFEPYIQFQAGHVIYPNGKTVKIAYMATSISMGETIATEFCIRNKTCFFNTKRDQGLFKWIRPLLIKSGIGKLFVTDQFNKILPVDAECTIYQYA